MADPESSGWANSLWTSISLIWFSSKEMFCWTSSRTELSSSSKASSRRASVSSIFLSSPWKFCKILFMIFCSFRTSLAVPGVVQKASSDCVFSISFNREILPSRSKITSKVVLSLSYFRHLLLKFKHFSPPKASGALRCMLFPQAIYYMVKIHQNLLIPMPHPLFLALNQGYPQNAPISLPW